ncbi:MAG: AIR synthase family protein [Firmicutes bacterium]|nr:AIR synthase family protein [Bacillota bacterium]
MLPTGKLDSDLLKQIVFDKIRYRSDEVKVRPGIGEDCACVGFGDFDCVMSTDPITSAVSDIGRLSIHITCNDIASNGVQPLGIMLAVMLPEGTTEEDVEHIMGQAAETAAALQVEIIGGHTEITPAVKQPVIVSTAIGKTPAGTSQSGNDMEPGDFIMMTKAAGLEGSGIIACGYAGRLRQEKDPSGGPLLSEEEILRAKSFLDLVSVVAEGVAAGRVGTHGMHDITEGGILGAVWEMCQISGTGAEVWEDAIPIEPETRKICSVFDIDPLRLISSGSMVIIVPKAKRTEMEEAMAEAGVTASVIGVIRESEEGVRMIRRVKTCGAEGEGRISVAVDPPYADEIYKVAGREKVGE